MAEDAKLSAAALVNDLYAFRDHYFEHHEVATHADVKAADVKTELDRVLGELEQKKDALADVALFNLFKGRALNVLPEHSPEAEALLSKCVKLNPDLVQAWCNLGECFWKRGDVRAAHDCFRSALDRKRDKEALRSLSMALRQLSNGKTPAERRHDVDEGVEWAKEAVKLDVQDGRSWLVLGNAYLSAFFLSPHKEQLMEKAMSAYNQAETCPITQHDADLHYNRSMALEYQGDFQAALSGFARALALEPSWSQPKEKLDSLLRFLRSAQEQIDSKGTLKEKRYQSLLTGLRDRHERDLGPFAGGQFTNSRGDTTKLTFTKLTELHRGSNKERVVLCKAMSAVPYGNNLSFACSVVDATGERCLVTIYNMGAGKGPAIGDSLAIPEPHVDHIDFTWPLSAGEEASKEEEGKTKPFKMAVLRVSTPEVMVVNGRKMDRRWTAIPVLQNQFFGD